MAENSGLYTRRGFLAASSLSLASGCIGHQDPQTSLNSNTKFKSGKANYSAHVSNTNTSSWLMEYHDPYASSWCKTTLAVEELSRKTHELASKQYPIKNIISDNSNIYVSSGKEDVVYFSLNSGSGDTIWSSKYPDTYHTVNATAVGSSIITYTYSGQTGLIRSINKHTGKKEWEIKSVDIETDLITVGNTLYFGTANQIQARSVRSGNLSWRFETGSSNTSIRQIVVKDGLVVASVTVSETDYADSGRIVAVDPDQEKVKWEIKNDSPVSNICAAGNYIAAVDKKHRLVIFSLSDGENEWRNETSSLYDISYGGDYIFSFGLDSDHQLYKIRLDGLDVVDRYQFSGIPTPPVLTDESIVFGMNDNRINGDEVVLVDKDSMSRYQSYKLSNSKSISDLIVSNGRLIVSTERRGIVEFL